MYEDYNFYSIPFCHEVISKMINMVIMIVSIRVGEFNGQSLPLYGDRYIWLTVGDRVWFGRNNVIWEDGQ